MNTILVTGGAGFIGSNFVLRNVARFERIVTLDKLTYAGNRENLASLDGSPRHLFVQGGIEDRALVGMLLAEHRPRAVVHFAAESHVDRSIDGPRAFFDTNVTGTLELLEEVRAHRTRLSPEERGSFRFVHVSTDEVYGSLGPEGAFDESTPYAPNSPYAASKAASDHIARSYAKTYGVPVVITHCSNNYGPYQFPEKLIPLILGNALEGKPLPVYGDGLNVRDWLYVEDHCDGIVAALEHGKPGETYNFGGGAELATLTLVHTLCDLLDELVPMTRSRRDLVTFVADRPGHDRRYAIDATKAQRELGWAPAHDFTEALRKTVEWYLSHRDWCARIAERTDARARLGLTGSPSAVGR